jgi:hypothetical protein
MEPLLYFTSFGMALVLFLSVPSLLVWIVIRIIRAAGWWISSESSQQAELRRSRKPLKPSEQYVFKRAGQ